MIIVRVGAAFCQHPFYQVVVASAADMNQLERQPRHAESLDAGQVNRACPQRTAGDQHHWFSFPEPELPAPLGSRRLEKYAGQRPAGHQVLATLTPGDGEAQRHTPGQRRQSPVGEPHV